MSPSPSSLISALISAVRDVCTYLPARSRVDGRPRKEAGPLNVFILLFTCFFPPLTLQPQESITQSMSEIEIRGEKGISAFTWIHYLSSVIEGFKLGREF